MSRRRKSVTGYRLRPAALADIEDIGDFIVVDETVRNIVLQPTCVHHGWVIGRLIRDDMVERT